MIFYPPRKKRQYLFSSEPIEDITEYPKTKDICLPVVVDTEFQSPSLSDHLEGKGLISMKFSDNLKRAKFEKIQGQRVHITSQFQGIEESESSAKIFASPLLESLDFAPVRHDVARTEFHVVDWLRAKGYKASIIKRESKHRNQKFPRCEIVVFAHFALAELGVIFDGELLGEIDYKLRREEIKMGRRLYTQSGKGFQATDRVSFRRHLIRIEGRNYRLALMIVDSAGLHGVASYKDLCANSGVKLDFKDLLDGKKSQMIAAYFENPEIFDKYAIGDLKVYEILKGNSQLVESIYKSLGLEQYFTTPKLTIGATTKNLLSASIAKHFDSDNPDELIDLINVQSRSTYLSSNTNNTYSLLSKVRGGRCRNNRPTTTHLKGVLCDIDISGCYGEGQRNQIFPFGRPVIEGLETGLANTYETLGEWYKSRESELIDGVWCAIISNRYIGDKNIAIEKRTEYETLENPQDFFESWFEFSKKDLQEISTDTDSTEDDFLDPKTGKSKIFNHQIINGLLTSDGLDWILNVCSQSQRKELLEKLEVVSAIYYPASERVKTSQELIENLENFNEDNRQYTHIEKGNTAKITQEKNCHSWYGIGLGELLIDELLINRKRYPKNPKHPLNTLYKLFVNAGYGILVSPYFNISNVVVGNNITARARVLAWCMEKALYGVSSITDGCCFDVNKVIYTTRNRKYTASKACNIHHAKKLKNERELKFEPLGGETFEILEWFYDESGNILEAKIKRGEETLSLKEVCSLIDNLAWKHLQSLFDLKVLHGQSTSLKVKTDTQTYELLEVTREERIGQFEFETKSIYSEGIFHGSANYALWQGDKLSVSKMRAYTDKPHDSIEFLGDEWKLKNTYENQSPAKTFLLTLSEDSQINRQEPFIKQGILKPAEYLQRYETLSKAGLFPGDNIFSVGLIRELSLSQFTFKDLQQYKTVEREYESNKRRYHQSYEMFFTTSDGLTVDYQVMIENIDYAITYLGVTKLNGYLGDLGGGWFEKNHPMAKKLLRTREMIYEEPNSLKQSDYFEDESESLGENEITEAIAFEGELDFEF